MNLTPSPSERRKKAGLKQSDIALILNITQAQVSKYESGEIPTRLLMQWARTIGCTVEDLLTGGQPVDKKKIFDFDENIYGSLTEDLKRLLHYIKESPHCDKEPHIKQFRDHVKALKEKPWVVTIGHYDAGKSHFCNFCLEEKRLPTDYQPVTQFPTFVRHISDRPKWIKEDVWIMKPEFKPEKWNRKGYCTEHKKLAGSWDTLEQYATVKEKEDQSEKGSVLAFLDAPLLHSCVLVDLPGYDTEMTKINDAVIDRVIPRADILLFFSAANGFLNNGELTCFSALLRNLRSFKEIDDNFPTLGNLFIIASQAHPGIKKNQLDDIIKKSSKNFYEHFEEDILSKLSSSYGGKPISREDIRARFFSFYQELPKRREALEEDLRYLLHNYMPSVRKKFVSATISKFKQDGTELYAQKQEEYQNILNNMEKAKSHYEKLINDKEKYNSEEKDIKLKILMSMDQTIRKTQEVFSKKIDEQKITDMITERYKEREEAQQQAPAYVIEKVLSETDKLQEDFVKEVHKLIENFGQYSEKREQILEEGKRQVFISYNEEINIGVGGFAGFSMLNFGLASLGQMVGYSGVLTFLTVGIGASAIIAIAATLTLIRLGGSWQQRLAKEIHKILKTEDIRLKIENNIRSCGDEMLKGLEKYYTQHQEQIKETEKIINSQKSHSKLEEKLKHYKKIENFFADIPWRRE